MALVQDGRWRTNRRCLRLKHLHADLYARLHDVDTRETSESSQAFEEKTITIVPRIDPATITEVVHAFGMLFRSSFAYMTYSHLAHIFCAVHRRRFSVMDELPHAIDWSTTRIAPFPHPVPAGDVAWCAIAFMEKDFTSAYNRFELHLGNDPNDRHARPKPKMFILEYGVCIGDGDNIQQQQAWIRWSTHGKSVDFRAVHESSNTYYHDLDTLPVQNADDGIKVVDNTPLLPQGERRQLIFTGDEIQFDSHLLLVTGSRTQESLTFKCQPELIEGRLFVAIDISSQPSPNVQHRKYEQ